MLLQHSYGQAVERREKIKENFQDYGKFNLRNCMENEKLNSGCIVNFVLNAFLATTAIILNSVTIQALRKTPSLPEPLKTLLLSLTVFDLGVGLLVTPCYFGLLVKWLQRNNMLFSYYFEANGGSRFKCK